MTLPIPNVKVCEPFMLGNELKILNSLQSELNLYGYPISGEFELRIQPPETMWGFFDKENGFRNPPTAKTIEMARNFYFFGNSGDGSCFAVWKHSAGINPVVCFSSSGNDRVLAINLEDFLALLAVGYRDVSYDDITEPPAPDQIPEADIDDNHQPAPWFLNFLQNQGIARPRDGSMQYYSTIQLNAKWLLEYFNIVQLHADYLQIYFSSSSNPKVPPQVGPEDVKRGFKKIANGIAVYLKDRRNLLTQISVHVFSREVFEMRCKQDIGISPPFELIVTENCLFVSGVSAQSQILPVRLENGKFLAAFITSIPQEKTPHFPMSVSLYLQRL